MERYEPGIVGEMKAAELREALNQAIAELKEKDSLPEVPQDIENTLQLILTEIRGFAIREAAAKENTVLRSTILEQQRFMEQLDFKDRENNVLIFGVPEGDFQGTQTDDAKCDLVFKEINPEMQHPDGARRLGRPVEGRNRPLLIKVGRKQRSKLLANSKRLKEAGGRDGPFGKIFVKKDVHPAISREWKRLRDREAAEKAKPENVGCTIQFDPISRELRRNDVTIDSWMPQYFLNRGSNVVWMLVFGMHMA